MEEERAGAHVTLAVVERRRWQLVAVSLLLLVLTAGAVALLGLEAPRGPGRISPVFPSAFLAVAVLFSLYVLEKERELRRLSGALLSEQAKANQLASQLDALSRLTAATRTINATTSPAELPANLLRAVTELLRSPDCVLLVADGDAGVRTLRLGAGGALLEGPAEPAPELLGSLHEQGVPLLVDGDTAARFPGLAGGGRRLHAAMLAPLVAGERLEGALAVSTGDPQRTFDGSELHSLGLVAGHAAVALANARQITAQERALEDLTEAERRRADLLAMITHELKTPLTSLIGYLQLLIKRGDRVTGAQRADFYANMLRQAQRMLEMIEDLLQSSRLDGGAQTLKREPLDLAGIVAQLQVDFRGKAPDRQIEVAGGQLDEVYGDRGAVEHILQNLIDNALKYSPPQGRVFITIEDLSSEVIVSVRDEGPGVPASELGAVFERFRRAQVSGPRGSVGLGLHIVRSLVQAHGGRVWCESPPGSGACFRFTLPRRSGRAGQPSESPRTDVDSAV